MPVHVLVYVGVVIAIALLPGPDTAVVTKNALIHGRSAALGTAVGINVGLCVWTLATALGVASLLRASGTAFDALKLAGAAYLIWMGLRALRDSRRHTNDSDDAAAARVIGGRGGFRQGMFSNLANPKVAVFFTSLLPQFVSTHHAALPQLFMLGAIFIAINLVWMSSYAMAAVRMSSALKRPHVKAMVDRISGVALVGVGVWLATERR